MNSVTIICQAYCQVKSIGLYPCIISCVYDDFCVSGKKIVVSSADNVKLNLFETLLVHSYKAKTTEDFILILE